MVIMYLPVFQMAGMSKRRNSRRLKVAWLRVTKGIHGGISKHDKTDAGRRARGAEDGHEIDGGSNLEPVGRRLG